MVSQISENSIEPFNLFSPQGLLSALKALHQTVESEGEATFDQWKAHIQRPEFLSSALNLAQYLALRRHDLRTPQAALMPWGLSSLGRIEARVMPNLDAVIATLEVICGKDAAESPRRPSIDSFFEGDRLLQQHTEALFGSTSPHRRVRIMVTFWNSKFRGNLSLLECSRLIRITFHWNVFVAPHAADSQKENDLGSQQQQASLFS